MADVQTKDGTWIPYPGEKSDMVVAPTRLPIDAIKKKGVQLRAEVRSGKKLDPVILYERYVDMWQELRLFIVKCKNKQTGRYAVNAKTGEKEAVVEVDVRGWLDGMREMRQLLDSMVKYRIHLGGEGSGIPRHALEKIMKVMERHPEAKAELLTALSSDTEVGA